MPSNASRPSNSKPRSPQRPKQFALLNREKSAYGGDLLRTRAGRKHGRPLSTRETMHLVLRSTQAKGEWSFKRAKNDANIRRIVRKFSFVYGVRVISMANVGNHLHLQIKLTNRFTYGPFIRSITGAIAMAVTGRTRWTKGPNAKSARTAEASNGRTAGARSGTNGNGKFWDYRPFTRIVQSFKAFLSLNDYIKINEFEGYGYKRDDARFMLKVERQLASEHAALP